MCTPTNKYIYLFLIYSYLILTAGHKFVSILSLIQPHNCITTVYRSSGTKAIVVVVRVAVRIEHVVTVNVRTVHIAKAEVSIDRVTVSITRT